VSIVTIVYKSGVTVQMKTDDFHVKKTDGEITEIRWTGTPKPRPLYIGVDDIAAIYEGKV